jgi:hypothetical protein
MTLPMVLLAPRQAKAITIRHDVPDSSYVSLAELYPSVGRFSVGTAGTLIGSQWVLTAAHVAVDLNVVSSTFAVGGVSFALTDVIIHPDYVSVASGNDLALVRLQDPVLNVTPSAYYNGVLELSQIGTSVGFGASGTGLTGSTGPSGIKRGMQNTIDLFGDGTALLPRTTFLSDFDNPNPLVPDSTTGSPVPLGLEGLVALGDSGGGVFIDLGSGPLLAGVHSYTLAPLDGGVNSDYGDLMGSTRVSLYDGFIQLTMQQVPEPSTRILGTMALALVFLLRRSRPHLKCKP